jgi:hypothetical protein
MLSCSILHCSAQSFVVLQYSALFCIVLHCPALSYIIYALSCAFLILVPYPTLSYNFLHCPTLSCTILRCSVFFSIVLCRCTVLHMLGKQCFSDRNKCAFTSVGIYFHLSATKSAAHIHMVTVNAMCLKYTRRKLASLSYMCYCVNNTIHSQPNILPVHIPSACTLPEPHTDNLGSMTNIAFGFCLALYILQADRTFSATVLWIRIRWIHN